LWLAQSHKHSKQSDDDQSPTQPKRDLDESQQGASPYSLFDEPEPVMAADLNFDGRITKANFLRAADLHFSALDTGGAGYLTLAHLPKTPVQARLDGGGRSGFGRHPPAQDP
jgi:hypothetical protein